MKAIKWFAYLCLIVASGKVMSQDTQQFDPADSTGLPGDNFSLQGALAVFKESETLEEFEKKLNSKDIGINNLDLNGDGKTDFVKVVHLVKDEANAIVLQVPVSKTENQDIAVIEIEKQGENSAMLQIVGDEELYPKNTIVEPVASGEPADKGVMKKGPAAYSPGSQFVFVNVWMWPCVRFIYAPAYIVWISPWYWDFYPPWWSPWSPFSWRWHYMHTWHYHHHYHYADYHYTQHAHQVYAPRRSRSAQVTDRYRDNHVQYNRANPEGRPRSGAVQSGRPSTPAKDIRPARPVTRPQAKPEARPQVKPETRPQVKPESKPQTRPADRPDRKPEVKPQRPATQPKPQVRPQQQRPQVKPQTRPSQPSRPPQSGKPQRDR